MADQVVSVSLPDSTLYVSGTVNDVAYVWTNTEGDTWEATVARSDNDVYRVALTAINTLGVSADYSFTLYYGISNLITDRTQADVNRVKALHEKGWASMTEAEQAEFLTAMKGAYNAEDLNRVESAVAYVGGLLAELPGDLMVYADGRGVAWDKFFDVPYDEAAYSEMETVTNWEAKDLPTETDLVRYLGNVVLVRGALEADYPALPETMSGLTYVGANSIERVLELVYDAILAFRERTETLIDNTAAAWCYSGEIYTGEV